MSSILIVDDDASFRLLARELLESAGFTVVSEAASAHEALREARRTRPHGVLLDVHLPDAYGAGLVEVLRSEVEGVEVLLTSSDAKAMKSSLVAASGAVGFVPKVELATTDLTGYFRSSQTGPRRAL